MKNNGFAKSCSKTARRFFEDFDLLPWEVKELLVYGGRMPNFDDLKEAWKLAEELLRKKGFKPEDLLKLHCFEEEAKEARKKGLKKKREQALANRDRRYQKWYQRGVQERLVVVRRPKDERLIKKVSEEEAARLLTTRKENRDVKVTENTAFVGYYVPVKKSEPVADKKPSATMNARVGIGKAFHNG
jgi:hypothetical protein